MAQGGRWICEQVLAPHVLVVVVVVLDRDGHVRVFGDRPAGGELAFPL